MKKPTIFILFVLVIVGLASLLLAFPQGNRCHPTGVWTAVFYDKYISRGSKYQEVNSHSQVDERRSYFRQRFP
jgi:hypothetical protein